MASIGGYAFGDCSSLTSVIYNAENCTENGYYNSETREYLSVFENCSAITTVIIGDSVKSIPAYVFGKCSELSKVTIGNSVASIGIGAFGGCVNLSRVDISDINAWCEIDFQLATSNPLYNGGKLYLNSELVTEAVIEKATEIKGFAFNQYTELTSVIIGNSVTSIGKYAFQNCTGLTNVAFGDSITNIGYGAFKDCTGMSSITIGESVTSIGGSAFESCTGLTNITIPNSVVLIGTSAFKKCIGLTSITIPNSVTTIGTSVFGYCTGLTSVIIPNSVTLIGISAFCDCHSLSSVTIGSKVSKIEYGAFENCNAITEVYCKATTPPTCTTDNKGSYRLFPDDVVHYYATLYVPKGSKNAYESTEPWSEFYIKEKEFSGVESTLADDAEESVEYYTLQGVKVSNPGKGVYVKVQGGKATKVVL